MNKLYLFLVCCCISFSGYSQTGLITPTNSGGFENTPAGFPNNFWTAVNGAANQWVVGTGSFIGARGAYIGNGTTFTGTNTAVINHFYRSGSPAGTGIVVPVGATNVSLSFRYRQPAVDPGGDSLIVSVSLNAAAVPIAGTTVGAAYNRIFFNTATARPAYVNVGPINLSAYAGNSIRLVYTYVNNGVLPVSIPAVDSVALYYCDSTVGNGTLCPYGGTATLTNPMTGGAWTSSNTSIATVTGVSGTGTVTGVIPGTAIITYTQGNCQVKRTVMVNPPASIVGLFSVCEGNTITLSDPSPTGVWTSSFPAIASINAATGVVTGNVAGTSLISYTVGSCRATAAITVNPAPTIYNVTGGGGLCAGGAGVDVALHWSDPGIVYDLYNGTSVVGSLTGISGILDFGSFTTAGTYTVVATDVSSFCTSDMAGSAVLTITPPVVPSVSIAPTSPLTCAGNPISMVATPVNGGSTPTYEWIVNGTSMGMGADTYSYMPTSGDIVSVILYPGSICTSPLTATDVYTVTVTPSATPAVSVSVSPGNPACAGNPVTFSAIPVIGGSAPSYRWTKNGINVATGPDFIYVPATGDILHCVMFSSYACRSADSVQSTDITMAIIAGTAAPVVSISSHPGTTIAAGQPDTLKANVTGAGAITATYLWYVNGAPIAGATTNTFVSGTLANMDIVTCKVTNGDICARSTLSSVTIHIGALGIDLNTANGPMSIFPNPNRGVFAIKGSMGSISGEVVSIEITNMLGQRVYKNNFSQQNGELDCQVSLVDMPHGIYVARLNTGGESKLLYFVIK